MSACSLQMVYAVPQLAVRHSRGKITTVRIVVLVFAVAIVLIALWAAIWIRWSRRN